MLSMYVHASVLQSSFAFKSSFQGQFTQESHVSEVEKLMEKYVEQKMSERKDAKREEVEEYGLMTHEEAVTKKKLEV